MISEEGVDIFVNIHNAILQILKVRNSLFLSS